jgi:hypothetical protein
MQYLSYAVAGIPYMGVGRNMAFKKNQYLEWEEKEKTKKILSGDDDLFVNANAKNNNYAVEYSEESHTETDAKKSYKGWKIQKMRHLSTSKYYKSGDRFRIGLIAASQYLFLFGLISLTTISLLAENLFPYQVYYVVAIAALRYITMLIVMYFSMKKLCEKDLLFLAPLFEIMLLWIYPIWHFKNMFVKRHQWK